MIARCFPHYRSHTGLEQCVWLRCSSVMSRVTVSACVLSQDLTKLKMVHVRLYSVGRGGKVFSWTPGSAWRFRVFDYLLWNSKSFQLIHLKCIFSLGPFTPCGGLNVLEVFDSELDIEVENARDYTVDIYCVKAATAWQCICLCGHIHTRA